MKAEEPALKLATSVGSETRKPSLAAVLSGGDGWFQA